MAHDIPLKDYLNSINLKTEDLSDNELAMKKYPPYVINKWFSGFMDTGMHSNEMNGMYYLDKDLQYQYLLHSIRKSKRFSPWQKKNVNNDIELVKKYYGYSYDKAEQVMRILTKEQLEFIKAKLDTGGRR